MSINVEAIFRILQTPNGLNVINKLTNAGLVGSNGSDTLTGTSGNNLLSGGTGDDLLDGGAGNDVLSGGADDDTLAGGTGSDILFGGTGNDTLDGGEGNDQLWGNEGNDVYWIDSNDVITEYENQGEDTVVIRTGISYYSLAINFENLFNQTDASFFGVGNSLDNELVGGSGDDSLEGMDGNDTLIGLAGDDILSGGNGNDFLNGGDGQDILIGGAGDDIYFISDSLDEIREFDNGGVDSVRTNLLYYVMNDHVEKLIDIASDYYFEGHGNSLDNTIESNAATTFLFGYAGQDNLRGGTGNNFLYGGEGDDQLHGGSGNDTLVYVDHDTAVNVDLRRGTSTSSIGNDTFSGIENIIGGSAADQLTGDAQYNQMYGGGGNDLMNGEDGDDYLSGDAGDDELIGGSGNDQLAGGDGNDLIYGGIGDDTLSGDAGDDQLNGGEGNDLLFGGDGNDILIASAGNDELLGGTGTDTASFIDNFSSITVDLKAGTASSADGSSRLGNIENVRGSTGDDSIKGNGSDNVLSGEAGNDIFQDWLGSNTILGGEGEDTIFYANFSTEGLLSPIVTIDLGANFSRTEIYVYLYDPSASPDERSTFSENTLHSIENATGSNLDDFIYGSAEKNRLEGLGGDDLMQGGWGDDIISGGDGVDTLSFSYLESNHRLTVSLSSFTSNTFDFDSGKILEIDEIFAIENLIGGSGNDKIEGNHSDNYLVGGLGSDTLYGFDGNDYLTGDAGDDELSGGAGNDRLFGGDGNDILISGSGNDELQGGLGRDTASFIDAASSVTVNLESGTATRDDGSDILSNIENIQGSDHHDLIIGSYLNNQLSGGAGNDTLDGLEGNDNLIGESGSDLFLDWQGFNTIEGGDGEDTISYKDVSFGSLSLLRSPVITINLDENFSLLKAFDIFDLSGAPTSDRSILSQNFFDSIENAVGSHFVDFIVGNSDRNKIDSLSGDDLISGGFGDDIIDGGDGIDTLSFNYLEANQRITISLVENSSSSFNDLGIKIETDEIRGIENVIGSSGNDEISGNNDSNYLDGGSGWDVLYGLGGDDTLVGGSGGSYIDGGADSDTVDYRFASVGLVGSLEAQYLTFGSYVDTLFSIENIIGSEFSDELLGDSQSNRIDGRGGRDTLYGLDGKDTLNGGDDNDQLFGDADDDELIGGSGSDQLFGGSGDDLLKGGQGNDRLVGEAGDDWLADSEGFDRFEGGDGTDYADFSEAKTGIFASLSEGRAENIRNNNEESIFYAILNSIENLQGGDRDDILEGDNKINVFNGGGGADTVSYKYLATGHSVDANLITGQASVKDRDSLIFDTDTLVLIENLTGSSGNDTLTGNDQDNVLIGGDGADSLSGGGGNDVIYAQLGTDLLIDGGTGTDTLHVFFNSGDTQNDQKQISFDGKSGFTNFENLIGSEFSEKINADTNDNRIDGGKGDDFIYGGGGNDILIGGEGVNYIRGGSGRNIIDGTSSNGYSVATYDIIDGLAFLEGLTINLKLKSGNATLYQDNSSTPILIDDYINIFSVRTGKGDDVIFGNDENNIFWSAQGEDSIFAGGGNDIIDGGFGNDLLEGGDGADIFVFSKAIFSSSSPVTDIDTINDFGLGGEDKIDLRSYGYLDASKLRIEKVGGKTNVFVLDQGFTQQIVVEGPSAGSLAIDDFLLIGFSDQQTQQFDNLLGTFLNF